MLDRVGTAIVDEERQTQVALVLANERAQVSEPDAQVDLWIEQLLIGHVGLELARRARHELHEAQGAGRALGPRIEDALDAYQSEAQLWFDARDDRGVVDLSRKVGRNAIARGIRVDAMPASQRLAVRANLGIEAERQRAQWLCYLGSTEGLRAAVVAATVCTSAN